MKRSKYNKPFLLGLTALAASVIAGTLPACSSESTRDGYDTTTSNPTDPGKPGSPDAASPSTPGEGAPDSGAAAPSDENCNKPEPSKACGVSPQCGCSDGRTCDVVDLKGNARCVKAGEVPMGHPCGATANECAAGLTCMFGTCHAFCNNPGGACSQPGTGACVQVKTTDGADVPNLTVCRIACEPADPNSCGGAACIIDVNGNTECQTAGGSKAEGENCSGDECGPGLGCVTGADKKSTCKRWCRLSEDDCGTGKSCRGFSPEVLVRGVAYGSCN